MKHDASARAGCCRLGAYYARTVATVHRHVHQRMSSLCCFLSVVYYRHHPMVTEVHLRAQTSGDYGRSSMIEIDISLLLHACTWLYREPTLNLYIIKLPRNVPLCPFVSILMIDQTLRFITTSWPIVDATRPCLEVTYQDSTVGIVLPSIFMSQSSML